MTQGHGKDRNLDYFTSLKIRADPIFVLFLNQTAVC